LIAGLLDQGLSLLVCLFGSAVVEYIFIVLLFLITLLLIFLKILIIFILEFIPKIVICKQPIVRIVVIILMVENVCDFIASSRDLVLLLLIVELNGPIRIKVKAYVIQVFEGRLYILLKGIRFSLFCFFGGSCFWLGLFGEFCLLLGIHVPGV
jgi:hypothetical protein